MTRMVLVHWNQVEAEERAGRLREAGYDVFCHWDARANPRALLADPPDAFLISLSRLPAQGRELGGFLRRAAATRRVPLVFIAGEPDKAETARRLLPDAAFTTWESLVADLAAALALPPFEPVVPGAMDAYVDAPLAKKLGIKPASVALLIHAPPSFETRLLPLPDAARVVRRAAGAVDVALLFCESPDALAAGFERAAARVRDGGRLWILWKKRASGAGSSLGQTAVRAFGLAHGWVDYKVSAIDETWSGLCFARRKGSGKERA